MVSDQIKLNDVAKLIRIKYKNIIQELMLEYYDDECPYIQLKEIKIKKSQRCKGYGSAVMFDIIKFADNHNVQIKSEINNVFNNDLNRLYAFHRKHGFTIINNNNRRLIYRPKKKSN